MMNNTDEATADILNEVFCNKNNGPLFNQSLQIMKDKNSIIIKLQNMFIKYLMINVLKLLKNLEELKKPLLNGKLITEIQNILLLVVIFCGMKCLEFIIVLKNIKVQEIYLLALKKVYF
jgi:hypothetical protein